MFIRGTHQKCTETRCIVIRCSSIITFEHYKANNLFLDMFKKTLLNDAVNKWHWRVAKTFVDFPGYYSSPKLHHVNEKLTTNTK
ncbi:hypothetical protein C5167_013956 [Papaver somniferum]|uniref:Uncharacterized protein n=1 Tax=Papaver somniferum TaxID=3469 RepID=A0A4Y7J4W3_PAPSO|nr:hypothetical protein C5167_013956 [Papaver somniferum]